MLRPAPALLMFVAAPRRARLACVDRALRQFCARHAARLRSSTGLQPPFENPDAYINGASRWLAWHAPVMHDVYLDFSVRTSSPGVRTRCVPCAVPVNPLRSVIAHFHML